ncbi:hypothetical protein P4204_23605 [Pseudomonas aeruginosa]|nr:hypothetical protein [Pseudomonas aeruginosa]
MLSTAVDLGEPGVDARFGWGLLDLARAVRGPGQLFGDQRVTLDAARGGWNARDAWNNDIRAGGMLGKAGSGAAGCRAITVSPGSRSRPANWRSPGATGSLPPARFAAGAWWWTARSKDRG